MTTTADTNTERTGTSTARLFHTEFFHMFTDHNFSILIIMGDPNGKQDQFLWDIL